MKSRRFTGYNRRVLSAKPWASRTPWGAASVTIDKTGMVPLIVVQLPGPATIQETTNAEDLAGWYFMRYINNNTPEYVDLISLESISSTSTGARFALGVDGDPGDVAGTWKLVIPVDQTLVRGLNGGPFNGWIDPQTPTLPTPALPWSICMANFGSPDANNWRIVSVSGGGPGSLLVETGDPDNSPFVDLSAEGWTCQDGQTVTSVTDEGGGVLRVNVSGVTSSGYLLAISNGNGPLSAKGFRAATSFAAV